MTEEIEQTPRPSMEDLIANPYIKIIKNTKGYNFEFKILSLDTKELDRIHGEIKKLINKWESELSEL